jgi:crotonobetainyl-CoA:carnitine CoA-transferase CaiB-like acyl-CoA transferase
MTTIAKSSSLPGPLEDVTVLDITAALAGPYATLLLAGLGATVIKVENPNNPDQCRSNSPYLGPGGASLTRESPEHLSVSELNRLRNKLGITLNLKHPGAAEVFADLVRRSDIVVENFSSGTLDRLGAGYETVHRINPRAVYCSITGFGANDTSGSGKAMDTIIQALSGLMMTSGEIDHAPTRLGVPLADLTTPMFAIIGVLAALHQAKRTGIGQHVDVSMLGVMTSIVACEPFDALEQCGVPSRAGKTAQRLAPFGVYRAADGYVAICAPTDKFAHGVLAAIGAPELIRDSRFATRDQRVRNAAALDEMIEGWTGSRPLSEVLNVMEEFAVPSAEVRDPRQGVKDPRVVDRGETVPLVHPTLGAIADIYGTGLPVTFSESRVGFDQPPPSMGEHNAQVYGEILGYSKERIGELRQEGII